MEWGREIAVNGVRPAWLSTPSGPLGYARSKYECDPWFGPDEKYPAMWTEQDILSDATGWATVTHICLLADHFAYLALDKGFEPWGGGDAPDDWDGGSVLCRERSVFLRPLARSWWAHHGNDTDIIGYRKRAEPVAQLADTVTVRRMTEAEWRKERIDARTSPAAMNLLRELGLIRNETPLEQFARESGVSITDENRAAVEAALSWGKDHA